MYTHIHKLYMYDSSYFSPNWSKTEIILNDYENLFHNAKKQFKQILNSVRWTKIILKTFLKHLNTFCIF